MWFGWFTIGWGWPTLVHNGQVLPQVWNSLFVLPGTAVQ